MIREELKESGYAKLSFSTFLSPFTCHPIKGLKEGSFSMDLKSNAVALVFAFNAIALDTIQENLRYLYESAKFAKWCYEPDGAIPGTARYVFNGVVAGVDSQIESEHIVTWRVTVRLVSPVMHTVIP